MLVPACILSPPPTIEAAENEFALITNTPSNNNIFFILELPPYFIFFNNSILNFVCQVSEIHRKNKIFGVFSSLVQHLNCAYFSNSR